MSLLFRAWWKVCFTTMLQACRFSVRPAGGCGAAGVDGVPCKSYTRVTHPMAFRTVMCCTLTREHISFHRHTSLVFLQAVAGQRGGPRSTAGDQLF